jgi:hypothetical protein
MNAVTTNEDVPLSFIESACGVTPPGAFHRPAHGSMRDSRVPTARPSVKRTGHDLWTPSIDMSISVSAGDGRTASLSLLPIELARDQQQRTGLPLSAPRARYRRLGGDLVWLGG